MIHEYEALKLLEKDHGITNSKISPKLFEYKAWLSELLGEGQEEIMIDHLIIKGYAQYKDNDRIGFSKAGYTYLDEKYWLEQAYEIVDTALTTLCKRNDGIDAHHVRGNHKIEQKVVAILENKLTRNLSFKNLQNSVLEITEIGRAIIEEYGGIANFLEKVKQNEERKINEAKETNSMQKEVQRLTLESLRWQAENKDLRKLLEESQLQLNEAQNADIPINAIDRKAVITWQIATAIGSVVSFLLGLFSAKILP